MVITKAARLGGGVRCFWRQWWRPPYSYLVALLLVGGCTAWESQTAVIRDQYYRLLRGHVAHHRVPCRQWPAYAEVERRYAENRGLIDAIESAGRWGSTVYVRPGQGDCADRGEFYIHYAGRSAGDAILRLIGDDRFLLGVPYSMREY